MLGLPLTLVDELAPLALRMAQSRLAAAGGDVLARWASGLPSVVEIGRGPAGEWCVELVPAVALLPWTAAPPAAAEGHPRPYLIARLDVARLLDQLLPALAAEPASPRPPRPCLGSAGVSTGECHAQS